MLNLCAAIIFLCLSSCSDKPEYSTPAQSQINDYTAKLKQCKEEKSQAVSSSAPAVEADKTTINTNNAQASVQTDVQENDNNPKLDGQQVPETTSLATTAQEESPKESVIVTRNKFEPTDDDMIIGDNTKAPVVFVEYFSPTCPHCAYYKKEVLPKIKEQYIDTNKIIYVVREFIGNKQDFDAAILARCANNKESFFKFVSVLLEQQDSWSVNRNYREILTSIGQLGGVSPERYKECLNNEKLADILIANTKIAATSPKFIGTPAFFINGVQFTEPYTADAISRAIEHALKTSNTR
ncbi:DsbA family protein [Candidatus Trichorickettsia mobilis]|uniref:DsbA family protein n=1 Tax=Candidatus Trichorickettsia mobilis TaxID=1346319 RepID=UPI0029303C7B|nr:thioredoxin domain-containing protein [Candidatus Trichorickettsia mobilis]